MAKKRVTRRSAIRVGPQLLAMLLAPVVIASGATIGPEAVAQNIDGVSVNLGVLDDLDPMKTLPRLLMPSSQPTRGRVILTPPAGVDAITPQRARVVLRPPPGAPTRVASAPKISVPPKAPAAPAPPVSVTAPPAPASTSVPQPPAPIASVPDISQSDDSTATIETSGPIAPSEATSQEPEQATERSQAEQVAALPKPDSDAGTVSVAFGVEETDLPSSAAATLTPVAERMKSDTELRVQLLAYASSADGSPSSVRRKSLSRALSVREFLMDQGVQSTRIEVRALGDKVEDGAPDRFDAVVERR